MDRSRLCTVLYGIIETQNLLANGTMRTTGTENGMRIPKVWLEGIDRC
jgi:hypothetical protein